MPPGGFRPGQAPAEALPLAAVAGPVQCLAAAGPGFAGAAAAVLLLPSGGGCTALQPGLTGKPIACLAASQDGALLAVGEKGAKPSLWLCRLPDGAAAGGSDGAAAAIEELGKAAHNFGISALSFSPSGRLLASHGADKDQQLILWSTTNGRQLGRARCKESYDAIQMLSDERLVAIHRESLVVWALERCPTPGGSFKLSSRTFALPASPAPSRFVGLAALPSANPKAPRLVAATDGGQLLRLRLGAPTVDKAVDHLQDGGKVLAMSASADTVALACSSGEVRLLSAATLEPIAILPQPAGAAAAVACALGAGGSSLAASYRGGLAATWDLRDPQRPALEHASLRRCHSESISDAVLVPAAAGASPLLATASHDGTARLWALGGRDLASLSVVDLRARLGSSGRRLLSLAASPDGLLLAAGDNAGCVHMLSLASPAAPSLLASQRVDDADIAALAFAPVSCEALAASRAAGGALLLAVGSGHGTVSVWQWQPDGFALLGKLADHKQAISGLVLGPGGAWLCSASGDGRRLTYRRDAAGRLQLSGEAAVARGSFVGLAPALAGQVAVAASRGGRVCWEAEGKEESVQALQKTQGELTAFAVDPSLSLLVCATSRNSLLALSLTGGKAACQAVASCKAAHAVMATINKVLVTPDSRWAITVGSDAAVHAFALPPAIGASCREAAQRLGISPLLLASPALAADSSSSSLSSVIQPRNLEAELARGDSCSPSPEGPPAAPASAAADQPPPPPATALAATDSSEGEELLGGELPDGEPAGPPPEAAAPRRPCSIPASPNRQSLVGGRDGMQASLAELEALWQQVPVRPSTQAGGCAPPPSTAAAPAPPPPAASTLPPPAASPPPAAGQDPLSPAFKWGSPLETLSSISLGALHSPDVFANLQSPPPAAGAGWVPADAPLSHGTAAASPAGAPAAASPAPPTSSGSSKASKLRRLAERARDTFMGRRTPTAQSPAAGGSGGAAAGSQGVGAALDAADAARCQALLGGLEGVGAPVASPAAAAASPAEAFFSPAPGSVTVDIHIAAGSGEQAASASVNQPRRRKSWGPVPGSEPRRTLSSAGGGLSPAAGSSARPHSALGGQQSRDSFDVFASGADAAAAATHGSAGSGSAGGVTSRRLSFSFGGGGRDDGDTPSLGGKPTAAAAPRMPAFLSNYSPGLAAAQSGQGAPNSTPRLFLGAQKGPQKGEPAALPAAPAAPPAAPAAPAGPSAGPQAGGGYAAPLPAAASQKAKPAGLQGRPAVPRLDLSSAAPRMSASASAFKAPPAPSAAAAAKRKCRISASPAAESSYGSASSSPSGSQSNACSAESAPEQPPAEARPPMAAAAAAEPCAEADSPASKKLRKPAPSPPRLRANALFSPGSAAKTAGTQASRRRSSGGAARPVSGGGGSNGAFSFGPLDAELPDAELQAAGSPDLWSMPASHDPVADELADAGGPGRRPAPAPAADPSSAAASPAASPCASPAPSSPAASEQAPAAAPTAADVLLHLRRSLQALEGLSAPLGAGASAEVAALLAGIHHAAGVAPPAAPRPASPPAPAAAGQENAASSANAASDTSGSGCFAVPPGFREQLMKEITQRVLLELQASGAAGGPR